MQLEVVILAAGQGTRMRSALPKVLHLLGGRSLLGRVIDTARELRPTAIHVVVGHQAELVRDSIEGDDILWVVQAERLGTGHALQQVAPALHPDSRILVLYGDVPLVRAESLRPLVDATSDLALMTVVLPDPSGYGRILRSVDGRVTGNVEHRDASPSQLAIEEVNTGILCARSSRLVRWLACLTPNNAQGEFYLTDVISLAAAEGVEIATAHPALVDEVEGVNDRVQLARLERAWQRRAAEQLMRAGVTLRDPERLDIRGQVTIGMDTVLDVNVVLEGRCDIGQRVTIGPHCIIRDSVIGDDAVIESHSVVDGAIIGKRAGVGPFARIRPGSELASGSRVGNFVETKAVRLGEGSKANHLTYLGDATIGRDVNIGAGTITCNYDGAAKHRTAIGDEAFIGSNTSLVAPVSIGAGATVGAGSAITRDVPDGQLAVARGQQRNIDGWRRPRKKSD